MPITSSGIYVDPKTGGVGHLPMRQDPYTGELMPSGLDLQRAAEAEKIRKMQLMEAAQKQQRANQAFMDAYRARDPNGYYRTLRQHQIQDQAAQAREAAKAKAMEVQYEYSAKQHADIARFNNARQMIISSGNFSESEKQTALRLIDLQQANIEPAAMPVDPNKFKWPEGTGPGITWKDEASGSLVTGEIDQYGNPGLKLIQRWDQGPESQKMKTEFDMQNKLFDLRLQLATEDIVEFDDKGNRTIRQRRSDEIDSVMRRILGEPEPQKEEEPWWDRAQKQGLEVKESDKQLPPNVGFAKAYVRDVQEKYGVNVPDELMQAYGAAVNILRQFQQGYHF